MNSGESVICSATQMCCLMKGEPSDLTFFFLEMRHVKFV